MGYGKVGVSKERMCSYKHTHNSAVHCKPEKMVNGGTNHRSVTEKTGTNPLNYGNENNAKPD